MGNPYGQIHRDGRHAIIQKKGSHATCNQAMNRIYHSCTHTNYDNQIKSDTIIMPKDDRENIQARWSTCQVNEYITMSLYIQGDQNNHGKYRNHYAKRNKIGNQCNQHINIPNEYDNEVQRK